MSTRDRIYKDEKREHYRYVAKLQRQKEKVHLKQEVLYSKSKFQKTRCDLPYI